MYFTIGFKNKFLYQKKREREIRWENRCCRKHWGGIVGEVERISSKLCIIDSKVRKDFKNECQVNNEQHCWEINRKQTVLTAFCQNVVRTCQCNSRKSRKYILECGLRNRKRKANIKIFREFDLKGVRKTGWKSKDTCGWWTIFLLLSCLMAHRKEGIRRGRLKKT